MKFLNHQTDKGLFLLGAGLLVTGNLFHQRNYLIPEEAGPFRVLGFASSTLLQVFTTETSPNESQKIRVEEPKQINLYTGNASSWHIISNLSEYFTPAEEAGIETQQCGDLRNYSNPWQ